MTSGRRWPFYRQATMAAVAARVADGAVFTGGDDPTFRLVESSMTSLHDPDAHGLFCATGTAALASAYFGLGLERGAEVLCPTNTFLATVTPLLPLGLRPVLCDSDPVTGCIDLEDAARRVTARTQALVVTHLWGHPADLDAAVQLASRHGLALVEDCSHAHGVRFRDRPVGSFGDAAAFSLGSRKLVSGGIGGFLLTRRRDVYERALLFGQPKARARILGVSDELSPYLATGLGANLRGSPLHALLATDHLERLATTIEIKNENLALLAAGLAEQGSCLRPPTRDESFTHGTWYAFCCRWQGGDHTRDDFVAAANARGVPLEATGPVLHTRRLFASSAPLRALLPDGFDPLCDPTTFGVSDDITDHGVMVDTTWLYEPAAARVEGWLEAIAEVETTAGGRPGDLLRGR